MSFLCTLGLHRAERLPRWNNGYYFSRCRRCRRDLVRAAGEAWFVPHGYRVIWLAEPPAWAVPARLATATMPPGRSWADRIGAAGRANLDRWRANRATERPDALPISDVLRELRSSGAIESDAARDAVPDDGESGAVDAAVGDPLADAAAPDSALFPAEPTGDVDAGEPSGAADAPVEGGATEERDGLDPTWAVSSSGETFVAEPVAGTRWTRGPLRRGALIGLTLFALAVVAAIVIAALRNNGDLGPLADPGSPMQVAAATETAFVNARIVNCRASPVDRAPSLRKLPRGASVSVLAREEGWTSVSHRSRQCWVASRYLSREAPL